MIFKVLQPLTGKWFLYDNIRLVKTIYLEKRPEGPFDPEFVHLLPPKEEDKKRAAYTLAQVDLIFKDGPIKTVLFQSGQGYLMNDEGKTIERL